MPRLPGIPSDYPYLPDAFGLAYEDVWLSAADGTRLHAWLMWPRHWAPEQRAKRPTVLFFQVRGLCGMICVDDPVGNRGLLCTCVYVVGGSFWWVPSSSQPGIGGRRHTDSSGVGLSRPAHTPPRTLPDLLPGTHMHGLQENAGNMAFRLPYIKPFLRAVDCSLMILSYRGYGSSEGSPNERGLQLDGQVGGRARQPPPGRGYPCGRCRRLGKGLLVAASGTVLPTPAALRQSHARLPARQVSSQLSREEEGCWAGRRWLMLPPPGKQPTCPLLLLAVQAALDYLLGREDLERSNIFLLGKSLGGAVAFYVAKHNKGKVGGPGGRAGSGCVAMLAGALVLDWYGQGAQGVGA